jgi:uncharacterized protein YkwD
VKIPSFKLKKIRHKLYALLSGGLVLSQIMMGITYYSGPGISSETPEVMSKNIITYTNNERSLSGLTPLTENEDLDQAARLKLEDMFTNNYWEHIAPSGIQAWDFIKQTGYIYEYAGENLAKGYHDSNTTVDAWMDSQTHKDNILGTNYTDIGVAVGSGKLNNRPVTLAVQILAKPKTNTLAQVQTSNTSVLGIKQSASLNLFNPVNSSRIPYFIAWLVLFALIIFDGIELRKLGLHKSKKHMFEFRSALLINSLAFIILFVSVAAVI